MGAPQRRVVIRDDDPDVAALLEAMVAGHPAYVVAPPSADAETDVVVLGSHGGGADVDACAALAAVTRLRGTGYTGCLVLLVPCPDPITLLDALGRGADAVLDSARAWRELLPTLDELLDRRVPA
jgi:hypothetical protein